MRLFYYKHIRKNRYLLLISAVFLVIYATLFFTLKQSGIIWNNSVSPEDIAEKIDNEILSATGNAMSALASNKEIISLLSKQSGGSQSNTLIALDTAKKIFDVSIIYLMDNEGTVIISTDTDDSISLTGNNYKYRYYFSRALKGDEVIYPALGVTTQKRGLYFSYPVYSVGKTEINGVLVIKKDMDEIDVIIAEVDEPAFMLSPDGIIFSTNNDQWLYHYALPLSSDKLENIRNSRQFGEMEIKSFPSDLSESSVIFNNNKYYVRRSSFLNSQWEIIILKDKENTFLIDSKILTIIILLPFVLFLIIVALIKIILFKKKTENELRKSHNEITLREEKLKASLKEKDILLKEIHHRVKNNMQIINSLLSMQAAGITDNRSTEILKKSQNRIRAMALVHENIYESEDFSSVQMNMIITELIQDLFIDEQLQKDNISIKLDIDTVTVSIDQAVPLGLIINELVSNSFKYAFKTGNTGQLTVTLKRLETNECMLLVEDNGPGLPVNFSLDDSEDLGLQLVKNLVLQINGVLNIDRTQGLSYSIRFMPD